MLFSANISFLYDDLPFCERIRRAFRYGFKGADCYRPYDIPIKDVRQALEDTGLPMISLNTDPGDRSRGDFGLYADPNRRLPPMKRP